MRSVGDTFHDRSDHLKAQHRQDEQDTENFPRPPPRQPPLDPRKDHLHQNQIEERQTQQHDQCPRREQWTAEQDAEEDSEQKHAAETAGWIEQSVSQPNQEIRTISQRETKQLRGIWVIGEGGRHHRKNLPKEENQPQMDREKLGFSLGDQKPRSSNRR